ncbi:hypothetical protein [Nevskia sp.]|uniref:hypothetical protein n=1 Tax=Nevskia sp. TaxID=1929292 RepID=UPI0025DB467D|nr:hypothetical protein [Nevskia sp.]
MGESPIKPVAESRRGDIIHQISPKFVTAGRQPPPLIENPVLAMPDKLAATSCCGVFGMVASAAEKRSESGEKPRFCPA